MASLKPRIVRVETPESAFVQAYQTWRIARHGSAPFGGGAQTAVDVIGAIVPILQGPDAATLRPVLEAATAEEMALLCAGGSTIGAKVQKILGGTHDN